MFHQNTDAWYALLRVDIPKRLNLLKLAKPQEKPFLIECMEMKGYVKKPRAAPPIEQQFEEVEYREIKNKGGTDQQEFKQSVNDSLSYITGTKIATDFLPRLAEVHKRGTTQQETLDQKLSELYDNVLGTLGAQDLVNLENIKSYAIKMYHELSQVYKDTHKLKGEMKATRNRGYTMLSLYYSLINFGICISRIKLVELFNNYSGKTPFGRSDLSEAEKNMQMLLKLPEEHKLCLCNMKSLFDAVTINHIRSEIEKLQELGKFSEPVQKIQVAVLIHHITKRSMKTISEFSEIDEDTLRKYSRIYTEILK